jgi:hypothetical protein
MENFPANKRRLPPVSCLPYISLLKMEGRRFFETLVDV